MSPTPAVSQKDTIYLDIDEEITNIIGKVSGSPKNIVALVLPKRATVLQSIVNMKLLKRAADQAEKKVVLITSEAGLMPLAGAAGIYVASNLNAKPYLPPSPVSGSRADPEQTVTLDDKPIDPQTPVGKLMGNSNDDTVEIDNSMPIAAAAGAAGAAKKKSGKKLSVPNFDRFRKKFFIIGALLLLVIIGWYWAFFVAPKATVTLKTESSEITAPINFTADTAISDSNFEEQILRADKKEISKTDTEKVPATGEKDKGTKAGGVISLKNCSDDAVTIPAGTGVSSGSFTFITQTTVRLDRGEFSSPGSGSQCQNSGDHIGNVNVVSQNNGDQYNLSPRSYTVAGFSGVSGQGEQMSGGTTNKVKVISQIDVDAAKQKIADKQKTAKDELKQQFAKDDLVPLDETFAGSTPVINATPVVDSEASEVTVTSASTYTMIGVKKDDLKKLVREQLKKQPDTEKKNVLNEGIDTAEFATGTKPSPTATTIAMQTTVILGPGLNQDDLKKQVAGKKSGEAESVLGKIEGVTEARVTVKPFWATKIPKKPGKVQIIIQQANGQEIKP